MSSSNLGRTLVTGLLVLLLVVGGFPFRVPLSEAALPAYTNLVTAGDTTDGTSFVTASITPTANRLVLACIINTKATTPDTPTLTGNGITWVQISTQTFSSVATPTMRLTTFRGLVAAPTAGAVTIDFAANTQTGALWSIGQWSDVNTSGTNGSGAVAQTGTVATLDSGTSIAPTLAVTILGASSQLWACSGSTSASGTGAWATGGTSSNATSILTPTAAIMGANSTGTNVTPPFNRTGLAAASAAAGQVLEVTGIPRTIQQGIIDKGTGASVASQATNSVAPIPNSLVLVAVANKVAAGPPNTPTLTGNGLTYVQVATTAFNTIATPLQRITVFRAMGTAPTVGAITIDFAGQTQQEVLWQASDVLGVSTGGTNGSAAVVQSAATSTDSATTLANNLSAFGNPGNAHLSFMSANTTAEISKGCFNASDGTSTTSGTAIEMATSGTPGAHPSSDFFSNTSLNQPNCTWGTFAAARAIGSVGVELLTATQTLQTVQYAGSTRQSGAGGWAAGNSNTSATSYTTASITPVANQLTLVAVLNSKATLPDIPTLSGNGLTYVQIATVVFNTTSSPLRRLTLFRALGASPSAGAITIDFAGATQTGATWQVQPFAGVDTSGSNGSGAVQRHAIAVADSAATLQVTLSTFARATNVAVAFFAGADTAADPSSWYGWLWEETTGTNRYLQANMGGLYATQSDMASGDISVNQPVTIFQPYDTGGTTANFAAITVELTDVATAVTIIGPRSMMGVGN